MREATHIARPLHILRAGELEATWAPGVGMVGCSLRHRGEELLGQRNGLEGYAEHGSTFGVPFLHPWANRVAALPAQVPNLKREEHGLPIHGLLTAAPDWVVEGATDRELRAVLDFPERLLPAFPYPHRVELSVVLDPGELTVTTTLLPGEGIAVPVAFGFHPYLTLPGVPREEWEIALPVRRRVVVDDRALPTAQREEVEPFRGRLGERSFDDGFDVLVPGEPWVLAGGGRRLEVAWELEDFPVAQVFTPPRGAPAICFEPMTAPTNALVTGDGLRRVTGPFSASWSLSVA